VRTYLRAVNIHTVDLLRSEFISEALIAHFHPLYLSCNMRTVQVFQNLCAKCKVNSNMPVDVLQTSVTEDETEKRNIITGTHDWTKC
jgi:hypothetical protein